MPQCVELGLCPCVWSDTVNHRDFSEVKFVWVCDTVCGVGSVSLCVELHSELQRLLRGEVCGSVTVCGVAQ